MSPKVANGYALRAIGMNGRPSARAARPGMLAVCSGTRLACAVLSAARPGSDVARHSKTRRGIPAGRDRPSAKSYLRGLTAGQCELWADVHSMVRAQ
jgi:hypothetical protein